MIIGLLVPDNFSHHAGDGTATRKHHLKKDYHPALQACPGSTQASYVLEVEEEDGEIFQAGLGDCVSKI